MDWLYEDELPEDYDYHENFHRSEVRDGVRMFPKGPAMGIKPVSEKGIQQAIIDYLHLRKAKVIRVNSGGMKAVNEATGKARYVRFNSSEGCADLIVCYRGRFVSIEVKSPTGKTGRARKAKQQAFAEDVTAAGGLAIETSDLQDIVKLLDQIDMRV